MCTHVHMYTTYSELICMCEHMHTDTYLCTFACTYMHMHISAHAYVHMYAHVQWVYAGTETCIHVRARICELTHAYVRTHGIPEETECGPRQGRQAGWTLWRPLLPSHLGHTGGLSGGVSPPPSQPGSDSDPVFNPSLHPITGSELLRSEDFLSRASPGVDESGCHVI